MQTSHELMYGSFRFLVNKQWVPLASDQQRRYGKKIVEKFFIITIQSFQGGWRLINLH